MPHSPTPYAGEPAALPAHAAAEFGLTQEEIRTAAPIRRAGFSAARLWKINGPAGPRCLREWPLDHPTLERLRFFHAVQRTAYDRGVTSVPRPIAGRSGGTICRDPTTRRLWELTPWMPGEPALDGIVSTLRLQAAFGALDKFHAAVADVAEAGLPQPDVPPRVAPSPSLRERLKSGDDLDADGVARLLSTIRLRPAPLYDELARRACIYFHQAWPIVRPALTAARHLPTRLIPCLRDAHREHILFTGDAVTGLIDFGAMRIETPLASVARLAGSYSEDDDTIWERGVFAGDAFSPNDRAILLAFDRSAAALSCFTWLRWIYEAQIDFNDQARVAVRLEKLLRRLERLTCGRDYWAKRGQP